jgi:membrane protease YdiL (CAAX protease family)
MMKEERTPAVISPVNLFGIALAVYLIWTLATYLLEGRLNLLVTGDPIARLIYALVANILIGTVLVIVVVKQFRTRNGIPQEYFGFQPLKRTMVSVLAAFILGLVIFVVSAPRTLDPVIVLNVFAQVFTTSTAEILVVYVLAGVAGAWMVRSYGRALSILAGIVLASVLFGAYHLAHSPPFNTVSMILLLTFIGAITGVFFFPVREIYSTIIFHNFFALIGVMGNIDTANIQAPNVFLLVMMLVTTGVIAGMDLWLIRPGNEKKI